MNAEHIYEKYKPRWRQGVRADIAIDPMHRWLISKTTNAIVIGVVKTYFDREKQEEEHTWQWTSYHWRCGMLGPADYELPGPTGRCGRNDLRWIFQYEMGIISREQLETKLS